MRRTLFAAIALSASLSAQSVLLNGRVVPASAPTLCPGFQFVVEGSNVLLDDSELDLAPFAGEIVALRGELYFSVFCTNPIVGVTSVEPATATLEVCGTSQAGCPLRLQVGPPTISINQIWAGVGTQSFLPLGDPLGTLLLTPPFVFIGSHGPLGSIDLTLPNLPGAVVSFQGYHLDVGPIQNEGSLSNPVRVQIAPPGGPFCLDPSSCF